MRFDQAWRILDRTCRSIDGKPPSTNKRAARKQKAEGADRDWWLENPSSRPPHDSPRSAAYLRAYLEIAGDQRFFAKGIPLDSTGYLLPDRGVMKALLTAGCVDLTEEPSPRFVLTDRGRALLNRYFAGHG